MNVSKTKDMIIDFRKNRAPNRDATVLKGQIVECVVVVNHLFQALHFKTVIIQ